MIYRLIYVPWSIRIPRIPEYAAHDLQISMRTFSKECIFPIYEISYIRYRPDFRLLDMEGRLCSIRLVTVCPGSSDPFYVVTYYIKRVTTSWTYSIYLEFGLKILLDIWYLVG